MRLVPGLALLALIAACRGPGTATPSGDLSYRNSGGSALLYQVYDSTDTEIDAGARGSLTIQEAVDATLSMVFDASASGMRVTTAFPDLSIKTVNPVEGNRNISEDDLEGTLSFDLDPRGKVRMVALPAMTPAMETVPFPKSFPFEMFPALPEEAPLAGGSWTDTISYGVEKPGGESESRYILMFTLEGDTVWEGIHALTGSYRGTVEITSSESMEGLEVFQTVSGEVMGAFALDPAGGRLLLNEMSSALHGTAEIPAAGIPPRGLQIRRRARYRYMQEG